MGENEMKSLLLSSDLGLLLLSDAAIAQTGTAQGTATPDKNAERSNDETIVVTATRREERLQDVPLSVTAYRQEELTQKGIVGYEGLARETPGVVRSEE